MVSHCRAWKWNIFKVTRSATGGCHFGSSGQHPAVAPWTFVCGVFFCCAMYPSQQLGMAMRDLSAVRRHYALPEGVWASVVQQIGDPGEDLKLLGRLPPPVIGAALGRARLDDGNALTAVQATHVGLVYGLTRWILHTAAGGDSDQWTEISPFEDTRVAPTPVPAQASATPDRKLKMTHILDQGDDGDFIVEGREHEGKMDSELHPNHGRVACRRGRTFNRAVVSSTSEDQHPGHRPVHRFCDICAVWAECSKSLQIQDSCPHVQYGYVTKEIPGPASFVQWRACFRVLRTALIMLDSVGLSNLHACEMTVERLTRLYPAAWHLIYSADELARSAHSNRIRDKVMMDQRAEKALPPTWDSRCPWDYAYGMLAKDSDIWQTQVHGPALVWLAAGSKGSPKTPAEQVAADCVQGGMDAIRPAMDAIRNKSNSATSSQKAASPSRRRTQARRDARKEGL